MSLECKSGDTLVKRYALISGRSVGISRAGRMVAPCCLLGRDAVARFVETRVHNVDPAGIVVKKSTLVADRYRGGDAC